MLSRNFVKSKRLRKPSEFSEVYKNNQTRVKGQYFIVLAFYRLENAPIEADAEKVMTTAEVGRLGAVVSKKVSKLAVQRNRIKRLIRENFRGSEHPQKFDFVVIAKPGAASAENLKLTKELNYLWKKLHTRCDSV